MSKRISFFPKVLLTRVRRTAVHEYYTNSPKGICDLTVSSFEVAERLELSVITQSNVAQWHVPSRSRRQRYNRATM